MKKEIDIFDKPKNIKIMIALFYIVLVVLIVVDAKFIHHDHSYFNFDGGVGFYAAFGFVACVMVITISKILRFFLIRDESYYDN